MDGMANMGTGADVGRNEFLTHRTIETKKKREEERTK